MEGKGRVGSETMGGGKARWEGAARFFAAADLMESGRTNYKTAPVPGLGRIFPCSYGVPLHDAAYVLRKLLYI